MPIVVNRDDDSDLRLRLVRFLDMYPVHLVARMVRHARPGGSANVAVRHSFFLRARPLYEEALLPALVSVSRFVIRATRERGVGVPSSRSLATASREAINYTGRNSPPGDLDVRDGHVAMIVGDGTVIEPLHRLQMRRLRWMVWLIEASPCGVT